MWRLVVQKEEKIEQTVEMSHRKGEIVKETVRILVIEEIVYIIEEGSRIKCRRERHREKAEEKL